MENKKNTATNNPEMVTISREEYESQQAQLTELKLQNQWLLEQLGLAKKRQFGASSERLQEGLMDQLVLMANEAEAYAYGTKNATEEQVKVKAHARKRQSGNVLDIVPEGTPTEVVEHRLSEEERICDTCGSVMEEIGKEVLHVALPDQRLCKYQPSRKAEHAEAFLKDFSGWLHADGYQGYHKLPEKIRVVGCWAHARRKFDEALQTLPKDKRQGSLAAVGECYCTKLFQLEETLSKLTAEERYTKRLELEKPVLDALLAWAEDASAKTAPKSALGKALHYLREQWPYLVRYLEDGRLELSNNRAERSIKPFVMGRKNWLFSNTPAGAQSSAVIYSLIETAKENDLDPYRYLVWLLHNAPEQSQKDEDWPEFFLPVNAPKECRS